MFTNVNAPGGGSVNARNAALSYRYLSQKAGINSSAFFPQVIGGARNLAKRSLLKVCKALDLQGPEAEFFENLVFFNQARTVEEHSAHPAWARTRGCGQFPTSRRTGTFTPVNRDWLRGAAVPKHPA